MAQPFLYVFVEKGPKNGHNLKCKSSDIVTVGRDRSNSLQITKDSGISQKHLCFRYSENKDGKKISGWTVEDTGSSNGTILNGSNIEPEKAMTINTGDIIKIGAQTTIRVEILPGVIRHNKQDSDTEAHRSLCEEKEEELKKQKHTNKASANKRNTCKKPLLQMQELEEEEEEDQRQKRGNKVSDNKKKACKMSLPEMPEVIVEEEKDQSPKHGKKASDIKKRTCRKPLLELQEVEEEEKEKGQRQKQKSGKKISENKKKTCTKPLLDVQVVDEEEEEEEEEEEDQKPKHSKKASGNKKKTCRKPLLEVQEEEEDQRQICGMNDSQEDFSTMTVQAWFEHMMEEGPKYLYKVSESIIQDMKIESEKFDEYIQSL